MRNAAKAKFFIVLAIIALVGASIAFLVAKPGLKRAASPPSKQVQTDKAEVSIEGFHFSNTESEKENWELTAKKADVSKETGLANLTDLEAVFSGDHGSVITLTADEGVFNTNTKDVQLYCKNNDIRVRSNNGYEMFAKDLSWDNTKKELRSGNLVKMSGKNIKIEGRGLVARSDLQEVRITNGVKTVFSQSK